MRGSRGEGVGTDGQDPIPGKPKVAIGFPRYTDTDAPYEAVGPFDILLLLVYCLFVFLTIVGNTCM